MLFFRYVFFSGALPMLRISFMWVSLTWLRWRRGQGTCSQELGFAIQQALAWMKRRNWIKKEAQGALGF